MTMYYRGEHSEIHCGDCLEVMTALPPVEMVLSDPPYGTTQCEWDAVIPFVPMWLNR